jgi:hypothetical protein
MITKAWATVSCVFLSVCSFASWQSHHASAEPYLPSSIVAKDDGEVVAAFYVDRIAVTAKSSIERDVSQVWSFPTSNIVDRTTQNELIFHHLEQGPRLPLVVEAVDLGTGQSVWRHTLEPDHPSDFASIWSFASYTHARCVAISGPQDTFIEHVSRKVWRLPRSTQAASGAPACLQMPYGLRTVQLEREKDSVRLVLCAVAADRTACTTTPPFTSFAATLSAKPYLRAGGGIVWVDAHGLMEVQLASDCLEYLVECSVIALRSSSFDTTNSNPNQVNRAGLMMFDVSDDGLAFAAGFMFTDRCPGETLAVQGRREFAGATWSIKQVCISSDSNTLRLIDKGEAVAAYSGTQMIWRQ